MPAALALVLCLFGFLTLRSQLKAEGTGTESLLLPLNDRAWRMVSAVLSVAAALCMLLPYVVVSVPDTITESVSASTINRSVSMLTYALNQ